MVNALTAHHGTQWHIHQREVVVIRVIDRFSMKPSEIWDVPSKTYTDAVADELNSENVAEIKRKLKYFEGTQRWMLDADEKREYDILLSLLKMYEK